MIQNALFTSKVTAVCTVHADRMDFAACDKRMSPTLLSTQSNFHQQISNQIIQAALHPSSSSSYLKLSMVTYQPMNESGAFRTRMQTILVESVTGPTLWWGRLAQRWGALNFETIYTKAWSGLALSRLTLRASVFGRLSDF